MALRQDLPQSACAGCISWLPLALETSSRQEGSTPAKALCTEIAARLFISQCSPRRSTVPAIRVAVMSAAMMARCADGLRPNRQALEGVETVSIAASLRNAFRPYTTCYNRFVRWRRAGVWGGIMNSLAATHDAAVHMIDTSIIRVHQHAACIARNRRSRLSTAGLR